MASYVSDKSSPTGFRRIDRANTTNVTSQGGATYTDADGNPITKEQAQQKGLIDNPKVSQSYKVNPPVVSTPAPAPVQPMSSKFDLLKDVSKAQQSIQKPIVSPTDVFYPNSSYSGLTPSAAKAKDEVFYIETGRAREKYTYPSYVPSKLNPKEDIINTPSLKNIFGKPQLIKPDTVYRQDIFGNLNNGVSIDKAQKALAVERTTIERGRVIEQGALIFSPLGLTSSPLRSYDLGIAQSKAALKLDKTMIDISKSQSKGFIDFMKSESGSINPKVITKERTSTVSPLFTKEELFGKPQVPTSSLKSSLYEEMKRFRAPLEEKPIIGTQKQIFDYKSNEIKTALQVEKVTGKMYKDVRGVDLMRALETPMKENLSPALLESKQFIRDINPIVSSKSLLKNTFDIKPIVINKPSVFTESYMRASPFSLISTEIKAGTKSPLDTMQGFSPIVNPKQDIFNTPEIFPPNTTIHTPQIEPPKEPIFPIKPVDGFFNFVPPKWGGETGGKSKNPFGQKKNSKRWMKIHSFATPLGDISGEMNKMFKGKKNKRGKKLW